MKAVIKIVRGDSAKALAHLPSDSIDALVTDPPYGLSKAPDIVEVLTRWLAGADYQHRGGGFMGESWDSFVPGPALWREVYRVLKPGAHGLVFFGTRTYDIGCTALRMAGFEIRDQLAWMYGSGFPKSKNIAMSIDKGEGVIGHRSVAAVTGGVCDNSGGRGPDRSVGAYVPAGETPGAPWQGWGTGLKPAQEPIVLIRKPLIGTVAANVLTHGTGGINVDGCRIAGAKPATTRGAGGQHGITSPRGGQGRIEDDGLGRWPANVIMDETAGALLDAQSGDRPVSGAARTGTLHNDSGGASRFFYCPKASKAERERGLDHVEPRAPTEITGRKPGSAGQNNPRAGMTGSVARRNHHPTVKPIELMRYLVRLITPPGGIVLDPFTGSGTTGIAAKLEDKDFLGFEIDPEYVEIARARIESWEK